MLVGDWDGLEKRSHNFLLVCRHWFEVASCSPELWSFWGNTLKDWMRWHSRSAVAPLDLVFAGFDDDHLDATVSSALRDYATRGAIRRVHLDSGNATFLNSVLFSLTPENEGVRSSQIKSLILVNGDVPPIDVSDFFARYSFQDLQRIDLLHCKISSWDHIGARTGALTDLSLSFEIDHQQPPPTTPQLFSLLTSNPALQTLKLSDPAVPTDDYKLSSFRIPLHHLKVLELAGELRDVFNLLHRLDHPILDKLEISPSGCTVADISQVVGPYLRNYLQHRTNSQGGLALSLPYGHDLIFNIGDQGEFMGFVILEIKFGVDPSTPLLEKAILDLIAHVPREEVTDLRMHSKPIAMGNIYSQLPNLETLNINGISLSKVFPGPDTIENGAIPVSLKNLTLGWLTVDNGDWSSLTTFLAHRASAGNPLQMLKITRGSHMCSKIAEGISRMVEVPKLAGTDSFCALGVCSDSDFDSDDELDQ